MLGRHIPVADPGEGPSPRPPLIVDQTEARRAEKIFFGDRAPAYLRVWMTPPPLISSSESGTYMFDTKQKVILLKFNRK